MHELIRATDCLDGGSIRTSQEMTDIVPQRLLVTSAIRSGPSVRLKTLEETCLLDWRIVVSSTFNAVLSMGTILSRRIDSSEGDIHSTGSATYLAARETYLDQRHTCTGARIRNRSNRSSNCASPKARLQLVYALFRFVLSLLFSLLTTWLSTSTITTHLLSSCFNNIIQLSCCS